MGSQIAQQAALCGVEVWLHDTSEEQLTKAVASNRSHVGRRVEKGKLTQADAEAAVTRVRTTPNLHTAVETADAVVEAIVEDLPSKRELFKQLDRLCLPTVLLASNSSRIGISKIASGLDHPERCCNMHFFHPVLVMELVEVVSGTQTSQAAINQALALAHEMGRVPVHLRKEVDGFIVNRILQAVTAEAYWLLDEDVASFEDIDTAVEKGLNWPMGPFRLGDFSGLDIAYQARLYMYQATGDERYKPSPQLEARVKAGQLGRKTGHGWYAYKQ